MMSGIRGKDTKPEMLVRRFLHGHGFRYRLHDRTLPGMPDLVFPRHGAVVFVHGCFWHRHKACKYATTPGTNADFWKSKFSDTVRRDRAAVARLLDAKWRVIILWECGLRAPDPTRQLSWLPKAIWHGRSSLVEWP